jgi:hypothetical protein
MNKPASTRRVVGWNRIYVQGMWGEQADPGRPIECLRLDGYADEDQVRERLVDGIWSTGWVS